MDTVTPQKRSWIMSRIRSRDTSPEMALRRALHRLGLRYRLHVRLPGRPDVVLRKHRLAIFVHGCWFHQHGCPRGGKVPKTNVAFWANKFACNRARDERVRGELEAAGWTCLVLWECEARSAVRLWRFAHEVLYRTVA